MATTVSSLKPFPNPVPSQPIETNANMTRGNDNLIQQYLSGLVGSALSPTTNVVIDGGRGVYVPSSLTIAAGLFVEIGAGSVLEIG